MNFEQFLNEGKFGDAAGLTKAQTKKVAETLAKAISKHDDCKCTVNLKTLEEDSFDLDVDGEEYDGGSYNIYDDGSVVNMAVDGGEKYGTVKSSVEDFIKGLDKPQKFESVENEGTELNEAYEVHYSDGIRSMKKFGSQSQAISFAKDLIKNKKGLQFVDVFNAGPNFHSTADTDAIVAFWGDGSYTDNVAKKDPKLAAKKIEESVEVNEAKKITVKRQYTESHPAQTVGKHAAIRNKIIEAIKDGISKAEFETLISSMTEDSKRWLRRNATYFKISEDQVTLSKFGKKVLTQTTPKATVNENNKIEMSFNPSSRSTFIYESFTEFVNNELVTEAIKSSILAGFLDLRFTPKELFKAFYSYAHVDLGSIEDSDFEEMDPQAAYKSKDIDSAIVFYVSTSPKENPYAPDETWSENKQIPAPALIAITNGKNEFFGVSWFDKQLTLINRGKDAGKIHTAGIKKRSSGSKWDQTGLYNVKRIAEVSDVAYVLDLDAIRQKYSTENIRAQRAEAKRGATAMIDPKEFKKENINRYKNILATRIVNDDVDGKIEGAITTCTDLISKAMKSKQFGQYGDIIVGQDPRGREIKITDVTNFMNNLLSDYTSYARYVDEISKLSGDKSGNSYYDREIKQKALYIKEKLAKLDKLNLAW